jgi:hypothetical protein
MRHAFENDARNSLARVIVVLGIFQDQGADFFIVGPFRFRSQPG